MQRKFQLKNPFKVVNEMLGRRAENSVVRSTWTGYKDIKTLDVTRTSYALARALFYANLYKDRRTNKEYGKEYLLGAPLAKPIVNIAAAFAIGAPVQVIENETTPDAKSDPKPNGDGTKPKAKDNPTIANLNQWLEEQRHFLYIVARNSFRDADNFVAMNDDGTMEELPPEDVEIIIDPLNPGRLAGYDVYTTMDDPVDPTKTITYIDEIRTTYRQRVVLHDDKKRTPVAGTRFEYRSSIDGGLEERKLPIIHFANEKEGRMLYGVSDYQSLFYLLANYHGVLEAAIKGNIYNSSAVPVMQGVKNLEQFLKKNFTSYKDPDTGETKYKLNWDSGKIIVGGEGLDVKMLQAEGTAGDAQIILNILFWLIAQNSETPEFVFGTAVQSSKASVSEQMPMLVRKAIRKQGQLEAPLRQMIDLYIERMAVLKPNEFTAGTQYTIDMPDILDDDLNVNLQIVNALLEKGIITEETSMTLLNLGKYIKDFDAELKKAKEQKEARSPIPTDAFGQPLVNKVDEKKEIDKTKKKPTPKSPTKIAEMLGPIADRLDKTTLDTLTEADADRIIAEMIQTEGLQAFITAFDGKLSAKQIQRYVGIAHENNPNK